MASQRAYADAHAGLPETPDGHRIRASRRARHVVRGGVVIGLLAVALVAVACGLAGLPLSAGAQAAVGAGGVLAGAILGAREPA